MSRSNRISLLFFLIFLGGILGVILYVNRTLNKNTVIEYSLSGDWANVQTRAVLHFPS
ncbi:MULTISPECIES: hypothetical protein [Antarcticibacterium]|uniref:hypothetical protein n=1 Tax=Antarcticibacterium TaxID=2058174 RepID=UPI00143CD934|nr:MULTISPECIES: hypothetical protein [Antarcticibacterium]